MRYSLIFLFLVTLNACAPASKTPSQLNIESQFQPYINNFKVVAAREGHPVTVDNLIVVLDYTMPGPASAQSSWVLATCTSGNTPTIRVNPIFWNAGYSTSDLEQLMFHELGHCVLGRSHDSSIVRVTDFNDTLPVTIMNPYHMAVFYYNTNHEYYMKELFGAGNLPNVTLLGPSLYDDSPYADAPPSSIKRSSVNAGVAEVTTEGFKYDANGKLTLEGLHCEHDEN